MVVRYWFAYPVQYRFVCALTRHNSVLDCIAPFTPIRLITEVTL